MTIAEADTRLERQRANDLLERLNQIRGGGRELEQWVTEAQTFMVFAHLHRMSRKETEAVT